MDDLQIAELTVSQLKKLIRETVQEAMAEVLLEFTIAAELDAEVTYRAEVADYLRSFLQDRPLGGYEYEPMIEFDD